MKTSAIVLALSALIVIGCGRNDQPRVELKGNNGEQRANVPFANQDGVQIPIGNGKLDEWGHLDFTITRIHRNQKPINELPYHVNGGIWNFFECRLNSDREVVFNVGVPVETWEGKGDSLGAVLVTNRWGVNENEKNKVFRANPSTGECQPYDNWNGSIEKEQRSPDGRYRIGTGKGELTMTEIATGKTRRLTVHEDDSKFVSDAGFEWLSPRYLLFHARPLSLVDVETLKINHPARNLPKDLEARGFTFSSDFKWVFFYGKSGDEEGLYLGQVKVK